MADVSWSEVRPTRPPDTDPTHRTQSLSIVRRARPIHTLAAGGVPISLHGENLGKAVSRGEITLLVTLPREPRPTPLNAVFVSERKISW